MTSLFSVKDATPEKSASHDRSNFSADEDAAMDQGRSHRVRCQPRFAKPAGVLGRTVGPSFRQREKSGRIESERQRAIERIIQEYIVDQELAARG